MRATTRRWPEDLVSIPFPTGGDRWEFTARQTDPGTGLRYHRARSHDPAIGQWTAQDPVGFAAGDANVYRYAGDGLTDADDGPGRSPS